MRTTNFIWVLFFTLVFFTSQSLEAAADKSDLFNAGIYLIPYPQEATLGGEDFIPGNKVTIVLDRNASEQDRFAATALASALQNQWGISAELTEAPSGQSMPRSVHS